MKLQWVGVLEEAKFKKSVDNGILLVPRTKPFKNEYVFITTPNYKNERINYGYNENNK